MTSTTTNAISKVAAIAASIALVAGSFAVAAPAFAQTSTTTTTTTTTSSASSLQAQIASLQAQLAAATGGSTMSMTFTRDLTIGSTGSDVTALQTWLIGKGFSIPAGATGYFGAQTKAALAAYQAANGISPAAGYFGPITRAAVNGSASTGGTTTGGSTVPGCAPGAMFSATTGQSCGSTTTGGTTLSGAEGSVNNFQTVGATNVTLGTGATQVVEGFQFMAGGSDLNVNRIYYDIYNPTNPVLGTTRPWNVFQKATLTNGSGQTVATIDATNQANYSQDGTTANGTQIYRIDFENINNVVKMGTTQQYFLTLSTQGAYAAGNVVSGTQFQAGLDSQGLRATDAMGLQQYSPSGTTNSLVNVNNNVSGTITLSTGSDNPQTTTVMGNQNTATQGVVLNTFTLQNQGSASVEVYTLPVSIVTNTGTTTMTQSSNLVQDLKLYQGSTLLDTESPASGFTSGSLLSFKNINLVIPAGTTMSFSVKADIQPIGGSNPAPSGSVVTVSVPGTSTDIETGAGALITPSGSSTGYPISFAVNGLSVASSPTSATAVTTSNGGQTTAQTGTFTFVFNVTAFGQSIYVGSTTNAYTFSVIDNSTGASASTTGSALTSTATLDAQGNWQVNSGQTATFTVTISKSISGAGHFYYAKLLTLVYGTSDSAIVATPQTVTLPGTYTTPATQINS